MHSRAAAIFEEAVAREGDDRLAYVRQACAGNSELQRRVEELLAHADGSLVIDRPVGAVAAELMENSAQMVGTQVGPYRFESRLGAGGMGEVYRATDTQLGRQVAIKTLPVAFAADPERVARFRRESKVLAAGEEEGDRCSRDCPHSWTTR